MPLGVRCCQRCARLVAVGIVGSCGRHVCQRCRWPRRSQTGRGGRRAQRRNGTWRSRRGRRNTRGRDIADRRRTGGWIGCQRCIRNRRPVRLAGRPAARLRVGCRCSPDSSTMATRQVAVRWRQPLAAWRSRTAMSAQPNSPPRRSLWTNSPTASTRPSAVPIGSRPIQPRCWRTSSCGRLFVS